MKPQTPKKHDKMISLTEAVERVMEARGVSRETAQKWLLEEFRAGTIRTYFQPDPPKDRK